eukprot:Skav214835  [mRNA]  locus=scaffold1772:298022:306375:+ [translate_table: standard]
MQQYTRQQRDQSMAQQEACGMTSVAIRSQERAKARAAEFRHRERDEEKARAMLQEEQHVRQQELAEVAQMERQRKRHWRADMAKVPERARGATPLRSDLSSRASSHPPLTRPAARQSVDHFSGRRRPAPVNVAKVSAPSQVLNLRRSPRHTAPPVPVRAAMKEKAEKMEKAQTEKAGL